MRRLFAAALCSAVVLPTYAAGLPEPSIEYSADSVLEAEEMSMHTRIFHAPKKERREVGKQGQQQVMILRADKNVSWMLMPDSEQYMEMPLDMGRESSGDFSSYAIQRVAVGKEKVNGMETTKYTMVMDSNDGIRFEGFIWISERGLLVKMDAETSGGEQGGRVQLELTNIRVGPQDPSLFEIPAGYRKFDVGTIGNTPPSAP